MDLGEFLLPGTGLRLRGLIIAPDLVAILAEPTASIAVCPGCGSPSGPDPRPLPPHGRRPPLPGQAGDPPPPRPPLPVHQRRLPQADLHRAPPIASHRMPRRRTAWPRPIGPSASPSAARPGPASRTSSARPRAPTRSSAGSDRPGASRPLAPRPGRRRFRLPQGPDLRHDPRRPGATPRHRPAPGPRGRHGGGVAAGAPGRGGRLPGPGLGLLPGRPRGRARRDAGGRPLAPAQQHARRPRTRPAPTLGGHPRPAQGAARG